MSTESISDIIKTETEKRLEIMQKDDYEFPKKVTKTDITVIVAGIVSSLTLIILCMTGAIV